MTRYRIKTWRKSRNDKVYTALIGSAWTDNKGVLRLEFDALPIPDGEGRVSAFLEADEGRDSPRQTYADRDDPKPKRPAVDLGDDEIPF